LAKTYAAGQLAPKNKQNKPVGIHYFCVSQTFHRGLLVLQARLPKGIKNIRPHIDDVDNVPLLVSLFTDCTPDSQFSHAVSILRTCCRTNNW